MSKSMVPEPSRAELTSEAGLAKTCGNCRLWGGNFYQRHPNWPLNTTCCADVVMDLPASFIPNRQTMGPDDGAECICWAVHEPIGIGAGGQPKAGASQNPNPLLEQDL